MAVGAYEFPYFSFVAHFAYVGCNAFLLVAGLPAVSTIPYDFILIVYL